MSTINTIGTKYLLDSMIVSSLKTEFIQSKFFKSSCFFSDEIAYEQRDNNQLNLSEFENNIFPVDSDILQKLKDVMEKAKIVKLYRNEGNGDVLTIATALSQTANDSLPMFSIKWKIVTSDRGLKNLAREFDIECIDADEFNSIIDNNSQT